MGLRPDEFLESFVLGNLDDCRDDPGCLRRAFNGAVSASHLADHYYEYNRRHNPELVAAFPKVSKFLDFLCSETSDAFRDIRSIANVYKHLYTDEKNLAHSTILSGGALSSVGVAAEDSEVPHLASEWEEDSDSKAGRLFVQFTRKDGSKDEFLRVLESFVDYWCRTHAWRDP